MQIALISSGAIPTPPPAGRYGGLERVVWLLACGLAAAGHEVALFAAPGSQVPPGGALIPYQRGQDIIDQHTSILAAADIVHDHGWELLSWWWAATHPTQPVVQTWHGPSLGPTAQWRQPPPSLKVVGLSRWHAWRLSAELGVDVPFIYNGVDIDAIPCRPAPQPHGPLLSLNRVDPAKGHHFARRVARHLRRPLWIAGPTTGVPDTSYVRQQLATSDGVQVRFWGDVDDETKQMLWAAASVVLWLTPGYGEPFGLGVVESLAAGVPVIAWADGSLPELVPESAGALVRNPGDVRAAWQRTRRMAPAACREAAARFSPQGMVNSYLMLYRGWRHFAPRLGAV